MTDKQQTHEISTVSLGLKGAVLPKEIENIVRNATSVSVWADKKHRTAILEPIRVIINNKSNKVDTSEILCITEKLVYKYTVQEDGSLLENITKIGEEYNEFGKKIEDI